MLATANHEMIVERDADGFCRLAHLFGHLDIGTRRRDVAARVIMDHNRSYYAISIY